MGEINTRAAALHVFALAEGGRQLLTPIGTIPGVILAIAQGDLIGAGDRNGVGKGAIRSEGNGKRIAWRAPGSATFGPAVAVETDGDYLLEDGEDSGKFVGARVKAAYLAPKPVERAVYLQHLWERDWPDVNAAQAAAGVTTVQEFDAENHGTSVISNTRVWLDSAATFLSLSVDGAGGPFTSPTSEATALTLKGTGGQPNGLLLPAAANVGQVWVRRIIPAAAASNAKVLALMHFAFDGF